MIFLADTSLDFNLVKEIRNQGYHVISMLDINPSMSDDDIVAYAFKNDYIIIAEDKDFGELIFNRKMSHHGLVLIRFPHLNYPQNRMLALAAFVTHVNDLYDSITVITPDNIRIRKY